MKKLILSAFLAVLAVGLVACGGDDSSSSTSVSTPPASTPPVVSSTPEPEVSVLEATYLTGEEKGPDYPEGKRIAAVMVNNIFNARPSYGLSSAQILVESKVEGGITRFMAMYQDYENMPRVGSLRSARDQFVALVIPTYGFYVHEGPSQNQPANWLLRNYDYFDNYDLQPNDGPLYWEEPDRGVAGQYSWHNVDGEHIANTVSNKGYDVNRTYNSSFFYFGRWDEAPRVPQDGTADEFTVIHSASYRTHFEYNAATSTYDMSMFNSGTGVVQPAIDANNDQRITFENVLVLYAPMDFWPGTGGAGGLVRVDYDHGGGGFYFSEGGYELLIWRKGPADSPLTLEKLDGSGDPVVINPGTTYIGVVDDAESENFYAGLKAGTSGEHVGEGTVDPNQTGPED